MPRNRQDFFAQFGGHVFEALPAAVPKDGDVTFGRAALPVCGACLLRRGAARLGRERRRIDGARRRFAHGETGSDFSAVDQGGARARHDLKTDDAALVSARQEPVVAAQVAGALKSHDDALNISAAHNLVDVPDVTAVAHHGARFFERCIALVNDDDLLLGQAPCSAASDEQGGRKNAGKPNTGNIWLRYRSCSRNC